MSAPTLDRPPAPSSVLAPRRRHRLRIALVVLGTLAAAAAIWLVWFSSVLAVTSVRVVGLDGTIPDSVAEQVLQTAAIPTAVPLARVDTDSAQQRVAQLPWVGSVDVRRGWPNEVVVAVSVRTPVARVGSDGTKAVDADGVVFAPVGPTDKKLPVVDATGDGLSAAVAVLASLPSDLARRVVSLEATSLDDVELTLRSGDLVRWGSADQPDVKATVLAALMKHKADLYDVSAPRLPTTYTRP